MQNCGIVIEGTSADAVIARLRARHPDLRELTERCIYDYVLCELDERVAVADRTHDAERWTELWDLDLEEGALMRCMESPDLPLGSRAFAFCCDSVTDSCGFYLFLGGRLRRGVFRSGGAVVEALGNPLPEEKAVEPRDGLYDWHFLTALMEALGFGFARALDADESRYRIFERWPVSRPVPDWATGKGEEAQLEALTSEQEAMLRARFGIGPACGDD